MTEWVQAQDHGFFRMEGIRIKFYLEWDRATWPKYDYETVAWYRTLMETWLFADYLLMPQRQNQIMHSLVNFNFNMLAVYRPAIFHDDITKCLRTLDISHAPVLYEQYCYALANAVVFFIDSVGGQISRDEYTAIFCLWGTETEGRVHHRLMNILYHRGQGSAGLEVIKALLWEECKVEEVQGLRQ
ncbi:uncharacterized protein B0I36DRAFT_361130 [Microdochium trichocladiopsis]|uniref:Uncharacterized protein n=1 Tax=Microdochium trichocladiopsis TaxID=1682393 RepID=A0A9P9BTP0_9PEZI|nr:uncharacterized protein B0I36DRAFT_361130 [Microdochium trichocladiopsis]KAH7035804.1 hypothetical protein B0I36DRAFT_361130 [Microdochium trichocladiopsis]